MKTISEVIEESGLISTEKSTQDIFNIIVAFYQINTFGPTNRELAEALTLIPGGGATYQSIGNVSKYLYKLEKTGMIRLPVGVTNRRVAGRIEVIGAEWKFDETTGEILSGTSTTELGDNLVGPEGLL